MSALRDRRFRRLLIGNSISSFGDSALYLSLGIWAKDLTGSNAAAGAIFLAQGLPYLGAPLAGHLVDRVKRRPLLITANAACAIAVLSLLTVHSQAQLWVMYAVSFAYGTTGIIIAAAGAGLLKDLLADDDLASANAARTTISQGLRIVSPLLGAALYARFGGGSVAVLDASTFAFAIGALLSVRITEHATHPASTASVRSELLAGVFHLRRDPLLAQITVTAAVAMLVLGFYESVTFAVIAAIGRTPSFFGVLMAIQAIGSIAGGLVVTKVLKRIGEARTLGVGLIAWVLASLLYAVPTLATACAALTIFGAAIPLYAVSIATSTQRHTPPALQGRVNTASETAFNVSQSLSIAIGVSLIGRVDYQILLIAAALVLSLAAVPVLARPVEEGNVEVRIKFDDHVRVFDDERIAAFRAATPGTAHRNHLNNAGAGLMTRTTLAAVVDHLRLESEIGGYEAADARRAEVAMTYQALADLVGGRPNQVALFDNSTHAWNAAFYSVPLGPGDRIVTSRTEYGSNVAAYWQRAEQTGCEVVVVPDDESGQLDLNALRRLLDERTKVVGLSWIPTAEGIVNPAAEVGGIVRDSGALYLLDATQAVGQLDLDVETVGCDVLTGTGRKWLRGPRGTGFCWLSDRALDRLEPHVVDLASMVWDEQDGFTWTDGATRFETWEVSYANMIGLGQAVREALTIGLPAIETQTIAMGDQLRTGLRLTPGVRVHDLGERQSAIVTMSVDGHSAAEVADALAHQGINVTTTTPGHNQLDMKARGVHPLLRLSPHYYNTLDELEQAVEVIRSL